MSTTNHAHAEPPLGAGGGGAPAGPRDCEGKPIWTLRHLARALPGMPGHVLRVAPTLVGRPISGALRERIMLAVAAENRCWYCQRAHRAFGEAMGEAPRQVDRILGGDDSDLPEGDRAALAFVRDLSRRGFQSRDEALWARLLDHFDEAQREAIASTAHVMNLANRFGNTFDAARARLIGRCPDPGAATVDLALLSALFLPAAAAVTPTVGLAWLRARLRGR